MNCIHFNETKLEDFITLEDLNTKKVTKGLKNVIPKKLLHKSMADYTALNSCISSFRCYDVI